jgi:hypothetical protein
MSSDKIDTGMLQFDDLLEGGVNLSDMMKVFGGYGAGLGAPPELTAMVDSIGNQTNMHSARGHGDYTLVRQSKDYKDTKQQLASDLALLAEWIVMPRDDAPYDDHLRHLVAMDWVAANSAEVPE